MKITVTVNADKRYYLDEELVSGYGPLLLTMGNFGFMKADLYEQLYKKSYLDGGPLKEQTYSAYLKAKYKINDYYNAAFYSTASGVLSSQKELKKLYVRTAAEDIDARDKKIGGAEKTLGNLLAMKASIAAYTKTGKWKRPYTGCKAKVCGSKIFLSGGKEVPITEYEMSLDQKIAASKNKLKQLRFGLSRKQQKLEDIKCFPPRRVILGRRSSTAPKMRRIPIRLSGRKNSMPLGLPPCCSQSGIPQNTATSW